MSERHIRSLVHGWETVRLELLNTKISDLGLRLEGSPVEPYTCRLLKELEARRIRFRPEFYLTDVWGCPNKVPVIGIPFYLADPRLIRLEEEQAGEIEDGREIMMYLRHEAGHAVNYAYRLWRKPGWRETFGAFSGTVPEDVPAGPREPSVRPAPRDAAPTAACTPRGTRTRISPRPSPSG